MNPFLAKLLDGAVVEWKPLGEVAEIGTGSHDTKDAINDGGYIFYARGREPLKLDKFDFDETAIITAGDGVGVGKVFHYAQGKYALHQRAYRIVPFEDLNPRYLFHFIAANFYQYIKKTSVHASVTSLRKPMFFKFPIPIPCPNDPKRSLKIQSQIVQILDAFTALTTELTTELKLRQQQYQYYRNTLLNFADDKVEWRALREVVDYEQPTKYLVKNKNYSDNFETPVLTAGKTFILGCTNEIDGIYKASKNPVIIFDDFTTANKWVDFDFKVKSSAMKMITSHDETKFSLKYVYYWLNTLPSGLIQGDHKRQWISNYSNKKIPIPPLAKQAEIVAILDKFDTLTQSLTQGLPHEIKLRKQQYEYYREQLLGFDREVL